MRLNNLIALPHDKLVCLEIKDGTILSITDGEQRYNSEEQKKALNFHNAVVFPGLINSHDHLDFNLFPALGSGPYKNYQEWGADLHANYKDQINAVLKVPQALRTEWGIYKNLLNGVTTVVNHGENLPVDDTLISVFQDSHSLHSVKLENNWKLKLNNPFSGRRPFAIHVGEGIDESAHLEIDELLKWNLFGRELVGIHAVAMNAEQAKKFKAIVWCPESNYSLLGKTAEIEKLKPCTPLLFGSDSTLSAEWNIWNHLRRARKTKALGDKELFNTLNATPAEVWSLPQRGCMEKGCRADLVIAKKQPELQALDSFFAVNPEDILMVVHKGEVKLFDDSLHSQLREAGIPISNFMQISIKSQIKHLFGDLPELMRNIRKHYNAVEFPVSAVQHG